MEVQAGLGINSQSILKIPNIKRASGMVQVAEYCLTKYDPLNSNPNTTKTKQKHNRHSSCPQKTQSAREPRDDVMES
jgi:hypothetical protein